MRPPLGTKGSGSLHSPLIFGKTEGALCGITSHDLIIPRRGGQRRFPGDWLWG
jgi:hypothetical protein